MTIFFDMDGTIANLYGVENWLESLIAEDVKPYKEAKALVNLNSLARILNNKQNKGIKIGVISWLSKNGSEEYNKAVTEVKINWLKRHLSSVKFDEVIIAKYGVNKDSFRHEEADILFDDEEQNRKNWKGISYGVENIIATLKAI